MDESKQQTNEENSSAELAFKRLIDQESLFRLSLIQRIILEKMRHADPSQLHVMWEEQYRRTMLYTFDKLLRLSRIVVNEHQREARREGQAIEVLPCEEGGANYA